MSQQDLLTVFIALTSVAVLTQVGILVGFYFLSTKISHQADRAVDTTRNLLGPLQSVTENLKAASGRVAEFSARARRRAA